MPRFPKRFQPIIDEQVRLYKQKRTAESRVDIPPTDQIPLKDPLRWLQIPNVISVFVDMKGSTQLSAQKHARGTAGAYQLFTGTAVALFHEFEAPYIDVRGDGVFALFNQDQVYRALAAAITFKTFAKTVFVPQLKGITNLELGAHIGIDQETVLVRKIGLKRHSDRTDRQNEVWAGKPVNMSSKLAAIAGVDELLVSERYYQRVSSLISQKISECSGNQKRNLWEQVKIKGDRTFDFETAYRLDLWWSEKHGRECYNAIMDLDQKTTANSH